MTFWSAWGTDNSLQSDSVPRHVSVDKNNTVTDLSVWTRIVQWQTCQCGQEQYQTCQWGQEQYSDRPVSVDKNSTRPVSVDKNSTVTDLSVWTRTNQGKTCQCGQGQNKDRPVNVDTDISRTDLLVWTRTNQGQTCLCGHRQIKDRSVTVLVWTRTNQGQACRCGQGQIKDRPVCVDKNKSRTGLSVWTRTNQGQTCQFSGLSSLEAAVGHEEEEGCLQQGELPHLGELGQLIKVKDSF